MAASAAMSSTLVCSTIQAVRPLRSRRADPDRDLPGLAPRSGSSKWVYLGSMDGKLTRSGESKAQRRSGIRHECTKFAAGTQISCSVRSFTTWIYNAKPEVILISNSTGSHCPFNVLMTAPAPDPISSDHHPTIKSICLDPVRHRSSCTSPRF